MDKKRFKSYLNEYFKLAKRDGIVFMLVKFSYRENSLKESLYVRLKTLYVMLDTLFFFEKGKKQIALIGLKSILGYNPDLGNNVYMDLFDGMELRNFSLKIITEKENNKLFNEILMYIISKDVDSMFYFKHRTRKHVVAKIIDKIFVPLIEYNFKINWDFFQSQEWVEKFIPIYFEENWNYAILNLIRLDFAERSFFICKGYVKRFNHESNEVIVVMTIDEYMEKLPALLNDLRTRYYFQLYFLDYNNLLVIHANSIKNYFYKKYLLPVIDISPQQNI